MKQVAFEKGQKAFRQGKSLLNNPYHYSSCLYDRWRAGWIKEDGNQSERNFLKRLFESI